MALDTCDPFDTIPPLLTPIIERNEPRGARAWRVRIAALEPSQCGVYFPTKRGAVMWLSENARYWARGATKHCELAGLIAPAPLEIETVHGWGVAEPFDPALDQGEHSPPGGYATCGDPIIWRLGEVQDLARHRLGWSGERWQLSLCYRFGLDNEARNVAWERAVADLASGTLSPSDLVALRATPETEGYLRLAHIEELRRRKGFGGSSHRTPEHFAREYWSGYYTPTHCWGST